jgi:hypothetical protein
MQHIPYTSLDEIERDRAEMAQFDEEFKATYGYYPAGHDYGAAGVPETDEEKRMRIASYDLSLH